MVAILSVFALATVSGNIGGVDCMIGSKSIMFFPIRPSRKQLDEDDSQE